MVLPTPISTAWFSSGILKFLETLINLPGSAIAWVFSTVISSFLVTSLKAMWAAIAANKLLVFGSFGALIAAVFSVSLAWKKPEVAAEKASEVIEASTETAVTAYKYLAENVSAGASYAYDTFSKVFFGSRPPINISESWEVVKHTDWENNFSLWAWLTCPFRVMEEVWRDFLQRLLSEPHTIHVLFEASRSPLLDQPVYRTILDKVCALFSQQFFEKQAELVSATDGGAIIILRADVGKLFTKDLTVLSHNFESLCKMSSEIDGLIPITALLFVTVAFLPLLFHVIYSIFKLVWGLLLTSINRLGERLVIRAETVEKAARDAVKLRKSEEKKEKEEKIRESLYRTPLSPRSEARPVPPTPFLLRFAKYIISAIWRRTFSPLAVAIQGIATALDNDLRRVPRASVALMGKVLMRLATPNTKSTPKMESGLPNLAHTLNVYGVARSTWLRVLCTFSLVKLVLTIYNFVLMRDLIIRELDAIARRLLTHSDLHLSAGYSPESVLETLALVSEKGSRSSYYIHMLTTLPYGKYVVALALATGATWLGIALLTAGIRVAQKSGNSFDAWLDSCLLYLRKSQSSVADQPNPPTMGHSGMAGDRGKDAAIEPMGPEQALADQPHPTLACASLREARSEAQGEEAHPALASRSEAQGGDGFGTGEVVPLTIVP